MTSCSPIIKLIWHMDRCKLLSRRQRIVSDKFQLPVSCLPVNLARLCTHYRQLLNQHSTRKTPGNTVVVQGSSRLL